MMIQMKMCPVMFCGILAFGVSALMPLPVLSEEIQVIDLGVNVTPADINNNGKVVGYRLNSDYTRSAIIYDVASGITEEIDGALQANAINDFGTITGNTADGAFLWENDTFIDLGEYYTGNGINEVGLIAGSKSNDNPYRLRPRPTNPAIYHIAQQSWDEMDIAQVYSRGTRDGVYGDLYTLLDINENDFGVGNYRKYGLTTAFGFLVTPIFDQVVRPGLQTAAAINNENFVAGSKVFDPLLNSYQHACLYNIESEQFIDLGTLNNGLYSQAMDINETNQVVGTSLTWDYLDSLGDPDKHHAFIWENEEMMDLNALLPLESGWILNIAYAINEAGDIAGTGWFNGANHGFILVRSEDVDPLPEPEPEPEPELLHPVALISAEPVRGRAPLEVYFDGTSSYDPDGSIVGYKWDFGNGDFSIDSEPVYVFTVPGKYEVKLIVTDNDDQTSEDEITIRVRRSL